MSGAIGFGSSGDGDTPWSSGKSTFCVICITYQCIAGVIGGSCCWGFKDCNGWAAVSIGHSRVGDTRPVGPVPASGGPDAQLQALLGGLQDLVQWFAPGMSGQAPQASVWVLPSDVSPLGGGVGAAGLPPQLLRWRQGPLGRCPSQGLPHLLWWQQWRGKKRVQHRKVEARLTWFALRMQ